MTYDDVLRQNADKAMHEPPWPSHPGWFMAQLIPSNLEDPRELHAQSMTHAIRIARDSWQRWKGRAVLRVTNAQGDEIYQGQL